MRALSPIYYEGIFSTYQDKGVSGINLPDVDFYWKDGIVAPEFRRETLSMCSPLFEKCIIYDGGARRYEIHEHVEEVLDFWDRHAVERADRIDFARSCWRRSWAMPLGASAMRTGLQSIIMQKIRMSMMTRWLYQPGAGLYRRASAVCYPQRTCRAERIAEFTAALRKYML